MTKFGCVGTNLHPVTARNHDAKRTIMGNQRGGQIAGEDACEGVNKPSQSLGFTSYS